MSTYYLANGYAGRLPQEADLYADPEYKLKLKNYCFNDFIENKRLLDEKTLEKNFVIETLELSPDFQPLFGALPQTESGDTIRVHHTNHCSFNNIPTTAQVVHNNVTMINLPKEANPQYGTYAGNDGVHVKKANYKNPKYFNKYGQKKARNERY